MKRFLYLLFLLVPFSGIAQAPTDHVQGIAVQKLLNRYIVTFTYSRGTGTNTAADSFVLQTHVLNSVCAPTNCLPAAGEFFKPSGSKTVDYSTFQTKTCGVNQLNCLKFRMKPTARGAANATRDTIIINCVSNVNLGVIIYVANGSQYKTTGYSCINSTLEPKIWTPASATVQLDSTPSNQVSNLSITNLDTTSFTLNWRNSFSDSVVVFGITDPTSTVSFTNPTNGTDYSSGATGNYPSAPSTGPGGWSVFYSGANTNPGGNQSLNIFNIPQSKTNRFHFRVLAYNKDVASPCSSGLAVNNAYFTSSVPAISTKLFPSAPIDTIQSFTLDAFDSVSISVSFNLPDCDSFLLVYSSVGYPNFLPSGFYNCSTDSNSISITSNFDTLRNGTFKAIFKGGGYIGQSKLLTIQGLSSDKYAYFTLFTFNSNGQGFENYNDNSQNLRAYTDAVYPTNCPIYQGSFSSINNNGGLNFFDYTIAWDRGINTSRTLVVLSQNGPITGIPNEKREYQPSDQFGLGEEIAPGEYVVYNDSGTFILVSDIPRLGPSTPIYFKLFSFNGTKISQVNPDSANTYYNIFCTADSFLLPVELKSIKSFTENDSVVFQWVTAMEKNNQGFQVQWSSNGKSWYNETFIPGKGNTSLESQYRWSKSLNDLPSQFFIRYQQVDFDGKISTSPSFSIQGKKQIESFQYAQNQDLIYLPSRSGLLEYHIFNSLGVMIQQGKIPVQKNEKMAIPVTNLPTGNYIVRGILNNQNATQLKFAIFR
jgi:hypothetical protein